MTLTIINMRGYRRAFMTAISFALMATVGSSKAEVPVPVANFTTFSDQSLSKYLNDNLNPDLKTEIGRRKLAVFAVTGNFVESKACYAMVGLTEAASKGRNSRLPHFRYSGFQTLTDKSWDTRNCAEEQLKGSFDALNKAKLTEALVGIESTASRGGTRKIEKPSPTKVQLYADGIPKELQKSLFSIIHGHEFGVAFDYRNVQSSIFADATEFANGNLMCVAFAGATGRTPESMNFRWPGYVTRFVRIQKGGNIDTCKTVVAEAALRSLLNEEWTDKGLLDNFAASREDGVPLPDPKKTGLAKLQNQPLLPPNSNNVGNLNAPKPKRCRTETRYESRPFNENVCDYNQYGPTNCRNITTRVEEIPYQTEICD